MSLSFRSASSVRLTPGCCHPSWTGQTWMPLNMLRNLRSSLLQPQMRAISSGSSSCLSRPMCCNSAVTPFPACRLPGSVARKEEHVVLNVIQTSIEGKQWRGDKGRREREWEERLNLASKMQKSGKMKQEGAKLTCPFSLFFCVYVCASHLDRSNNELVIRDGN